MTLGLLIVLLVIIGVVIALVPMDATIKKLLLGIGIVIFVLWLLAAFGLLPAGTLRLK